MRGVAILLFVYTAAARADCPVDIESLRPPLLLETGTQVPAVCADLVRGGRRVTAVLFSNFIGMRLLTIDVDLRIMSNPDFSMGGRSKDLRLIDLDRDGRDELLATSIDPHAECWWVFDVDDAGVARLISPRGEVGEGPLTDPEIVDLGANEKLLVVDTKEGWTADEDGNRVTEWSYTPYRMQSGELKRDATMRILSLAVLWRRHGKGNRSDGYFASEDVRTPAKLILLNGTGETRRPCSSGTVLINAVVSSNGRILAAERSGRTSPSGRGRTT